jgi:hypothetical protein
LAIHAKRGESIKPKAKGLHHHLILKLVIFKLAFYYVQKGEKVAPSKTGILKPSWTLRGEFIEGEFCLVKGKAFETGGENFKSYKCFSKTLFIYLWLVAKYLWKDFTKEFAKTKLVVQAWSKMLKL